MLWRKLVFRRTEKAYLLKSCYYWWLQHLGFRAVPKNISSLLGADETDNFGLWLIIFGDGFHEILFHDTTTSEKLHPVNLTNTLYWLGKAVRHVAGFLLFSRL